MGNRFKKIGFVNLLVFLVAGQAMAGPELSFKTGYTVSEDTYPYAFDSAVSSDPIIPILAPFGSGPFAGVGLAFSNVIGDYGLEIESNFFSICRSWRMPRLTPVPANEFWRSWAEFSTS